MGGEAVVGLGVLLLARLDLGVVSSSPISLRGAPCSYPVYVCRLLKGGAGLGRKGIKNVLAVPSSNELVDRGEMTSVEDDGDSSVPEVRKGDPLTGLRLEAVLRFGSNDCGCVRVDEDGSLRASSTVMVC